MITGDPFMLLLALVSMLFFLAAHADNDKSQWCYLACFIVSIVGAYVVPTSELPEVLAKWGEK